LWEKNIRKLYFFLFLEKKTHYETVFWKKKKTLWDCYFVRKKTWDCILWEKKTLWDCILWEKKTLRDCIFFKTMTVFCKKKKIMRLFCEKKSIMRLYSMREKNITKLFYIRREWSLQWFIDIVTWMCIRWKWVIVSLLKLCMSTFTVLFKSWQIIDPLLICYFPYNIFMYPVHQLLMFYLIPIMETNKLDYWFLKK
jgi:hypothetical protein